MTQLAKSRGGAPAVENKPLSVLILTRYAAAGASSRVRFLDWLPSLEKHGLSFTVEPLLSDDYLRAVYAGKRPSRSDVLRSYVRRLISLLRSDQFDLVWLEKEAFPWLPFIDTWLLQRSGQPVVVDIDDAIFHNYDLHPNPAVRALFGRKIDGLFARAALVTAGNSYLATRALDAGAKRVEIIPTVVDMDRYQPRDWCGAAAGAMRIGWIGSPATEAYLAPIAGVLNEFCQRTGSEIILIGARGGGSSDPSRVTVRPWSRETEVADLRSLDVGLMPLPDEPWARGKCGFKLIQYMACALPTIASPVGVNRDIVEDRSTGYLAPFLADWQSALLNLSSDVDTRMRMGLAGRRRVENHYSREAVSARLAALLRGAASRR